MRFEFWWAGEGGRLMSSDKCEHTVEHRPPAYLPLEDRVILLGVSGGIAAFKAAAYARRLVKSGARVMTVMTENARNFVTPLTFAALTCEEVHTDTFDMSNARSIPHISLARKADLMLMLPATANIIAKTANGIADDLLSTLYLAFSGPAVFCPAMNPVMYSHAATRENMDILLSRGNLVVEAGFGDTACGERGQGRLAGWNMVREAVIKALTPQSLEGLNVLVTAGPTRESIDPVRFVSNRSSGRMGYAVAEEAGRRGGDVTLVTGPCAVPAPCDVTVIDVTSAAEMASVVEEQAAGADVIIMAAAVADYTPVEAGSTKIKKTADELTLCMKRTHDILAGLLENRRPGQIITGFCAETGNLENRAMEKLKLKPVDLLVANDVSEPGAGFDVETNRVMLIDRDHNVEKLPLLSKQEVAARIMDRVEKFLQ